MKKGAAEPGIGILACLKLFDPAFPADLFEKAVLQPARHFRRHIPVLCIMRSFPLQGQETEVQYL